MTVTVVVGICCCTLQAALQLGLRASRRPAGYWDSLELLDMELDAFIAGQQGLEQGPAPQYTDCLMRFQHNRTDVFVQSSVL
jgi:hypothetical protein